MKTVKSYIEALIDLNAYPDQYTVFSKVGNRIKIRENGLDQEIEAINFCSNDILGLSQSDMVKQAAIDAIHKYGTSNSGCSLLNGKIELHEKLEREVSEFKNLSNTHLFLNAWMAMKGFMESFCHLAMNIPGFKHNQETLILTDIQNHGCITSAILDTSNGKISGQFFGRSPNVRFCPYRHCDVQSLSDRLKNNARTSDRIIVVSDAVFSLDNRLATAAQKHTKNMADRDFFSHTGHDNSKMSERITAEGYRWSFCAENISAGNSTPEEAVQGWMKSTGHRNNILNPKAQDIGVGYYYLANDTGNVNYKHYWTQVFAAPQ